jgi:hypothetical protein
MNYLDFITSVYQDQLGRAPDEGGRNFYVQELTAGRLTPDQVSQQINNSTEGQLFDTQAITSEYRTEFGRNPEQEGYQYWLSRMQTDPAIVAGTLENYIRGGASGADISAMGTAPDQFLEIMSNALQADPYAGRYISEDLYKVGGPNLSTIGAANYQFATPVNLRPVVSSYDKQTGTFTTTAGQDILDPNRVANAISVATGSGALSQQDANRLMTDLSSARSMDDVYSALSRPQAGVVVDRLYGMQVGEDVDMATARREALDRARALEAFDYTPSYGAFGNEMTRLNITNPFAASTYTARTAATPNVVATQQTLPGLLARTVNQSFGSSNFVPTPLTGQFYSERGLESDFIPFGQVGGPEFRSGVSGFTPNLPTGFQFGAPVVQAPVNVFTPGQFDPRAASYSQAGVPLSEAGLPLMPSSGGTVTSTRPEISQTVLGYTSYGEPIYAPMTTNDAGG